MFESSYIVKPGNIIGIGESSHGSATEFKWRVNFILDCIKNNPSQKFTIYIEAYKNVDWQNTNCLENNYKFLQTEEMGDFLACINGLTANQNFNIKIHGVDFDDKQHKNNFDASDISSIRNKLMYDNIKKGYDTEVVHFFWAHNLHVGKYFEGVVEVGKLLLDEYGDKYISIAQHVSKGEFRMRNKEGVYENFKFEYARGKDTLIDVSLQLFKETESDEVIIMSTSKLESLGVNKMQQAGFFWPMKESWFSEINSDIFDWVVLHRQSLSF